MMRISDDNLNDIIEFVDLPIKTGLEHLRDDLDFSRTWYSVHLGLTQQNPLPKKIDRLINASNKLLKLMEDEEVQPLFIADLPIQDNLRNFVSGLESVKECIPTEQELELDLALQAELELGKLSSIEWLAGKRLPIIFTKNFGRAAGFSRDPVTGIVSGPYIRFVRATMEALRITNSGKQYSDETIARALSAVRSGRNRRRKAVA